MTAPANVGNIGTSRSRSSGEELYRGKNLADFHDFVEVEVRRGSGSSGGDKLRRSVWWSPRVAGVVQDDGGGVVDEPERFKVEGVGDVAQGRRRRGGDGSPAMVWWRFPTLSALPLNQSRV